MQTIRFLLLFEAAAFAAAALIHFGVIAAGHGHQKAGVAESAIAAVLFTGAILTCLSRTWTRGIGLAAQAFALLAIGVQGMTGAPALRKLSAVGESEGSRLRHRVATGQRVAATLLMITVTCMAAARYI